MTPDERRTEAAHDLLESLDITCYCTAPERPDFETIGQENLRLIITALAVEAYAAAEEARDCHDAEPRAGLVAEVERLRVGFDSLLAEWTIVCKDRDCWRAQARALAEAVAVIAPAALPESSWFSSGPWVAIPKADWTACDAQARAVLAETQS